MEVRPVESGVDPFCDTTESVCNRPIRNRASPTVCSVHARPVTLDGANGGCDDGQRQPVGGVDGLLAAWGELDAVIKIAVIPLEATHP